MPLPTAILSTHTGDFSKPTCLDMTEEMERIFAHWETFGLKFDCVYTGYMHEKQLDVAMKLVSTYASRGSMILVDPVMGDNGKMYSGFGGDYPKKMAALCQKANVITPNLTEAALLTGTPYKSVFEKEELSGLYKKIAGLTDAKTVITGVRPNETEIGDVVLDGEGNVVYEKYLPATNRRLHGCGDVFASVLCARLVNGEEWIQAVEKAQMFTGRAIEETNKDAENHWYGLRFEALMDERF